MIDLDKEELTYDQELAYAEYLSEHMMIGNGTMLCNAMDRCELLDDFVDWYNEKEKQ